jgi:regulator of replication initiation timing
MTVVGKILVFINLLFSLVVGGLVTMVYVARTHWTDEYTKLRDRYQIAVASEEATRKEVTDARTRGEGRVKAIEKQIEKAQADLKSVVEENEQLHKDLTAQKSKEAAAEAGRGASQKEIERRQADVEQMRKTLKEEREANVALTLAKEAFRDRAVSAEIQMKSVQDKNQQLVKQLEETTKEIVRMRASGGRTTTTVAGGAANPPPENVDGLIETTDPASGLVTITLGSDAGLVKGHTLEVFRLNPIPTHSKYLGRIRIVEVTANKAVGQPTGRMTAPPQRGDHVASQIMVGGS